MIKILISVEEFATPPRAARARDFVFFEWKFVVVRELFAAQYTPQREDDDVLVAHDFYHFRVTIRLHEKTNKNSLLAQSVGFR